METEDKVTKTHHYLVLDSLRGVCACVVALYHFRTHGVIANLPVVAHGYLFVDFFFVLSGFVITASYRAKLAAGLPVRSFLGLRLGRIYPLHVLVLAIFVAFEAFFALVMPHMADRRPFTGTNSPTLLIAELFLIQIYVGADATPWNGPSWSIAAEFSTYAIFSEIYRFAGRLLVPLCLVLAIVGLVILGVATDRYINVFHHWSLIRCIVGFSLGVVAERLFRRWPSLGRLSATMVELAVIVGVVGYVSIAGGVYTLAAPPVFMIAVVIFAGQGGLFSTALTTWPFLYVGLLSYSIYMLHYFIQLRLVNLLSLIAKTTHASWPMVERIGDANRVGGGAAFGDAMSVLMLAIVIGTSVLTYRFVELPGQRFARARILGKRAQPRESVVQRG